MRPWCSSCDRPARVCLCAHLPEQPIHTATRVVILQHPHETRQKLATVPILARCLSNCHVIVGRRFQLGTSELFDALASSTSTAADLMSTKDSLAPNRGWCCPACGRRKCVLLLFPTPSAIELGTWMRRIRENGEDLLFPTSSATELEPSMRKIRENGENGPSPIELKSLMKRIRENGDNMHCLKEHEVGRGESGRSGTQVEGIGFNGVCKDGEAGHRILLVVDGTWQHAREMVKASMPFLREFVEQVCLPHDMTSEGAGMGDSDSIVKKEPFAGCVSTMEAVALSLGMLEPNGADLKQALLSVLRQMVFLQATHFEKMKPRPRLTKEHLSP